MAKDTRYRFNVDEIKKKVQDIGGNLSKKAGMLHPAGLLVKISRPLGGNRNGGYRNEDKTQN